MGQLGDLTNRLDEHIQLQHPTIEAIDTMSKQINYMADVVLGEPRESFDGTVTRNGGMKKLVQDHQNGGFKMKVPKWLVTILVAIIITIGTIGAAVIESNQRDTAQIEQVVEQVLKAQQEHNMDTTIP